MSTKLYDGYILPAKSCYQLQNFIDKLREKLLPIKDQLVLQQIALHVEEEIDNIVFNPDRNQKGFVYTFRSSRHKKRDEEPSEYEINRILETPLVSLAKGKVSDSFEDIYQTNHRDPSHDFQFTVAFIGSKTKTYAVLYTERSEYRKIWEEMKGVKYYPYWNNTDPLEGVTWGQWKKRGREWDKVLKGFSGPGLVGVTMNLLDERYLSMWDYSVESILSHMRSRETRIEKVAFNKALSIIMERLLKEDPKKYGDKYSCSLYFDSRDFIKKTEEGKELKEKMLQEVAPRVVDITEETLEMNFSQLKEKYGTADNN